MASVESQSIFAVAPSGSSSPDSITRGVGGSIWVEYGNGTSSTGQGGTSTIVQYSKLGDVQNTYELSGEVDGLKADPATGNVWALHNQDANSTLSFINPATNQTSAELTYGAPYVYGTGSSRGYDDVAFDGRKVFLSYTNPANPGDPVVQQLLNGNAPFGTLQTRDILRLGDTGTNLLTGETNQSLPVTDPDSLKTLPDGSLILTGEGDKAFTIIHDPGTTSQSASFITLPSGSASPDDAVMPTASDGTFYVSAGTDNDVVKASVTGLNTNDLYASIGNSVDEVDLTTGALTPLITGVNGAHGLLFVPSGGGAAYGGSGTPNPAQAALAGLVPS
ncbi:MAG: hypothetical protein JO143_08420 [Acetobacteraceae bacterium]|nr:hypothetical protein [Acetobacteraceae bacterium]